LDSEDSPDLFFLYSFDDNVDSKEKEDLINSQKFIWDTYKVLLDLTKTNSKLLSLYSQILKSAFVFCKENKRKVEFKRLCDSVRGYLQTLIKTEKKQFFQNKVQISRPEVLKILIQIRISLLDTATELEQWQEAFKTAEDIIFLMDKYEKSQDDSKDGKTKKSTKIPPLMKLEFYSNVEKLLWISDYPLYHAHSTILIKELASKAQKWAKALKTPEKIKEAQSKLEIFDIDNINNRIVLASLVTPFKNSYTNYVSIGSELFENGREIDTQTCSRMMSILKMNTVPGRANLINFIETHNLVSECEENIRNLYFLLQKETNPFSIARRGKEILNYLQSKAVYSKYVQLVSNNLTVRCMTLLAKNYDNISFQRLSKIITWVERENLEEILIENTRKGILTCTLDHASNIIKFKNSQGVFNDLSDKINNFYSTISKITSLIILNEEENNREKLAKIREVIYKEIHSHNTDSLVIYDALLNKMEQTNSKLASYLKDKENYKETLRESQLKEREEQKRKADEEAKMMKELLKDEQKKKEFDIQLKKYLIERIKIYTNVLFIDGKKVKLDEILKDLSKFSDEQLIKLLEKEEYEFKTKKEKKFKQIAKETDYVIREFRKRDYESTIKSLMEEEKVYNQSLEEESKKSYNEKIGFKSNIIRFADFKTAFFSNIQIEREIEYNDKMKTFSESLYKKVHEDLLKDMGPGFKSYVDEFRKREEESQLKQQNTGFRPTGGFMKKGEKFIREEKPKTSISVGMTDFKSNIN
jgi:translation initiation factor 3 subunit A